MSNELIRELVEALEYSSDFLSRSASRFDDVIETLAKARAYLETGGWTRVEDGLPVVPDGDDDVEVWIAWRGGLTDKWLWLARDTEFGAGITHWRYAESTPESPKG
jgi:hypothetical protein